MSALSFRRITRRYDSSSSMSFESISNDVLHFLATAPSHHQHHRTITEKTEDSLDGPE